MTGQVTTAVEERMAANEGAGWLKSPAYGGHGGDAFSDDLTLVKRLLGFVIRSGNRVDSIQAIYMGNDDKSFSGPQHGGNGGTQQAGAQRCRQPAAYAAPRASRRSSPLTRTPSRSTRPSNRR